jgi:lipopolysaccharide/colanic/teichoic acid biosynthesis glycosyltransferase
VTIGCFCKSKTFFFQLRPGVENFQNHIEVQTMNKKGPRLGYIILMKRLTKVLGGFRAKTSIDEIPQFNVIKRAT